MDEAGDLADRVKELEIKAGFAEDLLDRLNEIVHRQQSQIERLAQQIGQLRGRLADMEDAKAGSRGPRDELPPHY
ncbi:SlyX family protein [Bordetella bronchialis]|uniref:SlyX protein n=1 Tax=Bordetella bronchialis TaxID=463025 RepID=A0A193FXS2_9BORD|nr:SlyX family protein [Bordetella bronchialis]ANN66905.1 SlyX protein [Bordetella bronchialis]ANN71981.1 SlyX protein [Bordetella bronchialis]